MILPFTEFASRLREFIRGCFEEPGFGVLSSEGLSSRNASPAGLQGEGDNFERLALHLFSLQYAGNSPYRKFCQSRRATPESIERWTQIPSVPTAAFKEFTFSCLPPRLRSTVFHSSGTTTHRPSRHYHSPESLAIYEASLLPWFRRNVLGDSRSPLDNGESPIANGPLSAADSRSLKAEKRPPVVQGQCRSGSSRSEGQLAVGDWRLAILTPGREAAPHSSLVHMFESVRRTLGAPPRSFLGRTTEDDSWTLDCDRTVRLLREAAREQRPVLLLGTAFSFVHLVDYLCANELAFRLEPGSRVMETGGYKGRSRELPKNELHRLIFAHLGIPASRIVCEYGMSELSSQAYDLAGESGQAILDLPSSVRRSPDRVFQFPPWARPVIVSPETGCEVADGETGLIRVFDLANVFSVMAVQTEDLAIRRGTGFELIGRSIQSEPRGCSLNAETLCGAASCS